MYRRWLMFLLTVFVLSATLSIAQVYGLEEARYEAAEDRNIRVAACNLMADDTAATMCRLRVPIIYDYPTVLQAGRHADQVGLVTSILFLAFAASLIGRFIYKGTWFR
jgi:hypothetical protein